jgi:phosphopantothenate synthetase
MHYIARTAAVAVTAAVLSLGASPVVSADDTTTTDTPCATQEQQVAKAEDALARVTAVFARQKDQVAKWQERLAAATTPEEQARIQKRLDQALAKKADAKFAKKAQQKRLAKAQARLAECQAAQVPTTP